MAILLAVFRSSLPYVGELGRWLLRTRAERAAWLAATGVLTTMLFALGFDWLRWITVIAFAALLALAGHRRDRRPGASPVTAARRLAPPAARHVVVSGRGVLAVAAATYLLVLPPLPNFVNDVVVGVRLLLDLPQ